MGKTFGWMGMGGGGGGRGRGLRGSKMTLIYQSKDETADYKLSSTSRISFYRRFELPIPSLLSLPSEDYEHNKCAVSEIKGAPCTRRAQFNGRVHDLGGVHPVCPRFFLAIYYWYILGRCMEQFPGAQFYGKCTLRVHKIKA